MRTSARWPFLTPPCNCRRGNGKRISSRRAEATWDCSNESARYGGGQQRVELEELAEAVASPDEHILAVDEALEKLALLDPQRAQVVKLRYFVGLTIPEIAEVMGISEPTAKRYWSFARAWLYEEIRAQRA